MYYSIIFWISDHVQSLSLSWAVVYIDWYSRYGDHTGLGEHACLSTNNNNEEDTHNFRTCVYFVINLIYGYWYFPYTI